MGSAQPASSLTLQTTEILEHILSFLPGPDLFVASNVNRFFLNCIVNSPAARQTLLFSSTVKPLPECYQVHRIRRDVWGIRLGSSTLALTPTAGVQHDDLYHWATRCLVVRLCPGLQLSRPDNNKDRVTTEMGRYRDYRDERSTRATFIVQPTEMTRLGHQVLLTDPPVRGLRVYLCYRHSHSFTAVNVSTTIKQDSPFTLNGLVKSARLSKRAVWIDEEEPVVPRSWCRCRWARACDFHRKPRRVDQHGLSLEEVVAQEIRKHGGSFLLDLKLSWVDLEVIVPTAKEWELMEQVLAEEPAEKKQVSPNEAPVGVKQLLGFSV